MNFKIIWITLKWGQRNTRGSLVGNDWTSVMMCNLLDYVFCPCQYIILCYLCRRNILDFDINKNTCQNFHKKLNYFGFSINLVKYPNKKGILINDDSNSPSPLKHLNLTKYPYYWRILKAPPLKSLLLYLSVL